jgi:hypothetical protein
MKKTRKLSLHKETLRALDPESLVEGRGGYTAFCTYTCYCGGSNGCAVTNGCAGTNNSCGICHEN